MNNASSRKTGISTMACLSPKRHEVLLTMRMLEQKHFLDRPIVFWHTGGVAGAIDVLYTSVT
jgi:hypothetical protein